MAAGAAVRFWLPFVPPAMPRRISLPNKQVRDQFHGTPTAKSSLLLLHLLATVLGPERSPWLAAFEAGVGGIAVAEAGDRRGRV